MKCDGSMLLGCPQHPSGNNGQAKNGAREKPKLKLSIRLRGYKFASLSDRFLNLHNAEERCFELSVLISKLQQCNN